MRGVRRLGESCLAHAESALKTARTNKAEAREVYNYMKAYKLLADYYERKVLAAVAALVYGFGGGPSYRAEADKLADETVARYTTAIQFIWEEIDQKKGSIKGRGNGKTYTLPELIDHEKQERAQLAKSFKWPAQWASLIVHAGGPGAGTRMKLARNMLHFISFTAACEASKLAEAAGINLQELGKVVRHSDKQSGGAGAIMYRDDTKPLSPDHFLYQPFLHTRGLGEKDLSLAIALGDQLDVDLPLAQTALENLAAGLGVPHTKE